jgi:OmpA-OmpF porin, OOP family
MIRSNLTLALAGLICCSLAGAQAVAQSVAPPPGKVLQGDQVNARNLVDLLAPPPADADADVGTIRTRGLRPRPASETGEAPVPPPRRSASLLITFLTNSSTLTAQAREQLDVVGQALNTDKLAAFRFLVEGHADPRGNAETNLALSQNRADSVRAYLVAHHGIREERLAAVGKGSAEPMNRDNPAAAENRRVTIVTRTE